MLDTTNNPFLVHSLVQATAIWTYLDHIWSLDFADPSSTEDKAQAGEVPGIHRRCPLTVLEVMVRRHRNHAPLADDCSSQLSPLSSSNMLRLIALVSST